MGSPPPGHPRRQQDPLGPLTPQATFSRMSKGELCAFSLGLDSDQHARKTWAPLTPAEGPGATGGPARSHTLHATRAMCQLRARDVHEPQDTSLRCPCGFPLLPEDQRHCYWWVRAASGFSPPTWPSPAWSRSPWTGKQAPPGPGQMGGGAAPKGARSSVSHLGNAVM